MKKILTRAIALAGLLAVTIGLPGCSDGYTDSYSYAYGYSSVGVTTYSGYYGHGWGGCCYGPAVAVPVVVPYGYGY